MAPKGRATTPARKAEAVQSILAAWEKRPEMRLGQLIENYACLGMGSRRGGLFYLEDDELVKRIVEGVRDEDFRDSLLPIDVDEDEEDDV